jgi:hypothetical protein
MDAANLGISIFRGNVLDTVFSAIAMIPALGNAIATPLKAIFNAVGNSTGITKAVDSLGILFGGTSKIASKLSGISTSIKTFANKIPDVIASLKNNFVIKSLIGNKKLNNIVSGVKSGINSLIKRADEVISSVKKAVKKDIAAKVASKTIAIGETMTRVTKYANTIGAVTYKGFKYYDKTKQLFGKKTANLIGGIDNAVWIMNKMIKKYNIVDIGIDVNRADRSPYYLMERVLTFLYKNKSKIDDVT